MVMFFIIQIIIFFFFEYNSTLNKWVSFDKTTIICSTVKITSNINGYYGINGVYFTSTEGIKMLYNGVILNASVDNLNTITRDIEIRVNNSNTNKLTLSLNNSKSTIINNGNIFFNSGDLIQAFVPTSNSPGNNTLENSFLMIKIGWTN